MEFNLSFPRQLVGRLPFSAIREATGQPGNVNTFVSENVRGHFANEPSTVLVSDFDGTMTRYDFYKLAIEKLLPRDTPDFWIDYRAGRITHFEALRRYFAAIRGTERQVLDVVQEMQLDPHIAKSIEKLRNAGWCVVVASAGCDWYIRYLLASVGVEIEVHANPGQFRESEGLIMEKPVNSPYFSENLGVNKTAIVRHYLEKGRKVAFAGDGFPDADPARLVSEHHRFARGDLADVLRDEGFKFRGYDDWSEIAEMLIQDRERR